MSSAGSDERGRVKEGVEAGGGVLLAPSDPASPGGDCAVRLLGRTEICLQREPNMFLAKYVIDCLRENRILPNLADYRFR
jgi:hypothetical protein